MTKWNNGTEHKFKDLEKIKPFFLTEKDKSSLVERLFDGLPEKSTYLKSFKMLQVLDPGFMSDRKSEAQRTFREINDVSVISEDKKEQFYEDLKVFKFSKKYAYTEFKSKVISKYVISVQRSKVKEYLYDSNLVSNMIKFEEVFSENQKLSRMENWLYGIYFVPLEYSEINGLIGVKEFNVFEAL